jgi:hypothetical protein
VDSPAYADLDWKMALAGEVGKTSEQEEAPAEAEVEAEVEPAADEAQGPEAEESSDAE